MLNDNAKANHSRFLAEFKTTQTGLPRKCLIEKGLIILGKLSRLNQVFPEFVHLKRLFEGKFPSSSGIIYIHMYSKLMLNFVKQACDF